MSYVHIYKPKQKRWVLKDSGSRNKGVIRFVKSSMVSIAHDQLLNQLQLSLNNSHVTIFRIILFAQVYRLVSNHCWEFSLPV